MIALRPLSALTMLLAGVAAGLVDGVIAATTPTGRAISISPRRRSSEMMPTDFAPRRSRNSPSVLRRFFAILSSTLPRPVSRTARSASARLRAGSTIAQPAATTASSTRSCDHVSYARWAARARATSGATIASADRTAVPRQGQRTFIPA